MQPYIILYKTTLHMRVRNLPKVFTRQLPGRESNPVSAIRKSDALPVSHRALQFPTIQQKIRGPTAQSTASRHRHLEGCDGWGSRLTIYIANSPIIIDHHRSPTLREAIDLSITSHFQMASTGISTPCLTNSVKALKLAFRGN